MSTRNVYVVVGQTGEYSDRTDWYVAAYLDRTDADWHADQAMLEANRLATWTDAHGEVWRYSSDPHKPLNHFDAGMNMYYTGTDYYVAEVPLLAARPTRDTDKEGTGNG